MKTIEDLKKEARQQIDQLRALNAVSYHASKLRETAIGFRCLAGGWCDWWDDPAQWGSDRHPWRIDSRLWGGLRRGERIFVLARRWLDKSTMTLLIACFLIYHFDLPAWLYAVAAVVKVAEVGVSFGNWHQLTELLGRVAKSMRLVTIQNDPLPSRR
jgi:hypothetical protein